MSMHRQQAIRKVRVAQALVLIFAAGAAAAMVVPRPDHSLPLPSADVPVTTAPAGESRPASGLESQDLASVLIVLNTHVDIKDRAVAEARVMPEVVKDDPAPAQEQTKDDAAGTWRFVGSIISPRSTAAIINDEHNKQHIVFAGDKLNGTTLVAVTHDRIVLRDGDEHSASRELALEPRTDGQGVAWKGRLQNEHSEWEPVDHVSVTPGTGSRPTRMEFRRNGTAKQWYTCEVVHGHLLGHFSHHTSDAERPFIEAYPYAVEGWCPPPAGWNVGR